MYSEMKNLFKQKKQLYFDYAASTPIAPEVMKAMMPYFDRWYNNPSNKTNLTSIQIDTDIAEATENILSLFGGGNQNIIYTSGATESINTCLKSLYHLAGANKKQIITARTEHQATISVCEYLSSLGANIIYLKVNRDGQIDLNELSEIIMPETLVVTLMGVNNETGVVYDTKAISRICKEHNVPFVCDTTQMVGKIPMKPFEADYIIGSAHKIYGAKGVGFIITHEQAEIQPLIHGGGQQNKLRSGTLNVPGIIALVKALELSLSQIHENYNYVSKLQKHFETELLATGNVEVIGKQTQRSPYITNIRLLNGRCSEMIGELADVIAFSTSSACSSAKVSHVLTDMGLSNEEASQCCRFSFSAYQSQKEIDKAIKYIKNYL
jgi:Cysteine sulfinate desulfinase/cysteine desulfurase and related enzymes